MADMADNENDSSMIAELFESAESIAVVGIKDHPSEDAFRVPQYMQEAGYRILPVNPKHTLVLNEPCRPNLSEVEPTIDIVTSISSYGHV